MNKTRIAYLVSHPIQYQVPLIRRLTAEPTISLEVVYNSIASASAYYDPGFGAQVKWDLPLLEGYAYRVLDSWRSRFSFARDLLRKRYQVIWLHGYSQPLYLVWILLAKLCAVKVMVRGESLLRPKYSSSLKNVFRKISLPLLNKWVDRFLAIGSENKNFYLSYGIDSSKIIDVPYVVDNQFFQDLVAKNPEKIENLRCELQLQPGHKIILFASKLMQRKRANDLLKAYIKLLETTAFEKTPYLLIIGDGEQRAELEALLESLPRKEYVKLLGFKNQSELPFFFALCDVFVLPSANENWGLVVNEVMSLGKPVIVSSEVGCAKDLVVDGHSGFQFAVGDVDDLAEKLSVMLCKDEAQKQMAENSYQKMLNWGIPQAAQGILKACESLELV